MPRLKYFCEGLPNDVVKQAQEELGETDEVKSQGLLELKRLIREEPDFHPITDDIFLLRFLRVKKYDTEKAFKAITNYYKYKASYSGINTDFRPSDIKQLLEEGHTFCLEYREENNVGIGYVHVGKYDVDKYSPDEIIALGIICYEVVMLCEVTQIARCALLVDFSGFTLRTARQYSSASLLYRIISLIMDCLPCRVEALHIVNEPWYFKFAFNMLRPFLSKKVNKRTFLHGDDFKSLHEHISPENLPEDLGGKQRFDAVFIKEFIDRVLSLEDYFTKFNKSGYRGRTLLQLQKNNNKAIST